MKPKPPEFRCACYRRLHNTVKIHWILVLQTWAHGMVNISVLSWFPCKGISQVCVCDCDYLIPLLLSFVVVVHLLRAIYGKIYFLFSMKLNPSARWLGCNPLRLQWVHSTMTRQRSAVNYRPKSKCSLLAAHGHDDDAFLMFRIGNQYTITLKLSMNFRT